MRNFKWVFIFLLLVSCKKSQPAPDFVAGQIADGQLTLIVDNKPQKVEEEGKVVDFYPSFDKDLIFLDVEKLSTISVVKAYKYDKNTEKYLADTVNYNRKAWKILERKYKFDYRDLEAGTVNFAGWRDEKSLALFVKGRLPDGQIISDTVLLKY